MKKFLLVICFMFSVIGCEFFEEPKYTPEPEEPRSNIVYECTKEIRDTLADFVQSCSRRNRLWDCLETGQQIYCQQMYHQQLMESSQDD